MRPFTHCINATNVNEALAWSLRYLPYNSTEEESRAGTVIVSQTPVITCYAEPTQRVLFSPMRDANPFFHLMEALWMIAGRDDVRFPARFNSTFGQFSDDGERFWGAYGSRWRKWFGYDQLELIIGELLTNPASRRCVLAMWSPGATISDDDRGAVQPDLLQALGGGKDVPCNVNAFFRVFDGKLDMMVNCRSNDIFWGAYGANAVHFSFLQEYIASSIGVEVGRYWQNSFNFHAYVDRFPKEKWPEYANDVLENDWYSRGDGTQPIMTIPREAWDDELLSFMEWADQDEPGSIPEFAEPFFRGTAAVMRKAHQAYKAKDYSAATALCRDIAAPDWRRACVMWTDRRWERYARKDQGRESVDLS